MSGIGRNPSWYSPSGDPIIDGVLSSVKWADSVIYYAFPSSSASYSYGTEKNTMYQFNSQQQNAVLSVLEQSWGNSAQDGFSVEGFTNINVQLGNVNDAHLRFANTNDPNNSGAASYFPEATASGGDAWFGSGSTFTNPNGANYAFHMMMHELGHTLGLDHTQFKAAWTTINMPAFYDRVEYSVMSYLTYLGDTWGSGMDYNSSSAPQSFMMADIAGLQHLYGADYTTNSGSTVYSWSPTEGKTYVNGGLGLTPNSTNIFATIWDGGGTDTYDLSAYSAGVQVDLTPGSFSLFASNQRANLGDGNYAQGNIYNALKYQNNSASMIENAIGGSGADILDGNAISNVLDGNGANDTLRGKAGSDTLLGDGGSDTLDGGDGNDALTSGSGLDIFLFKLNAGQDIVSDFENALDRIHLQGTEYSNFNQVLANSVQIGSDISISMVGDTILIKNMSLANFGASDFIFS